MKLENAITRFGNGQLKPGIDMLNAFINQVNAFRNSGAFTETVADALTNAALAAIDAAEGGASLLDFSAVDELFSNLEEILSGG